MGGLRFSFGTMGSGKSTLALQILHNLTSRGLVGVLCTRLDAFGLLTDFRGKLFPATARFLELADTRHELQVEARCWCGRPATHNARLVDGKQVYEGDVIVLGDIRGAAEVSYELLCRRHWREGRTGP